MNSSMWVLGHELRSSARALCLLNHDHLSGPHLFLFLSITFVLFSFAHRLKQERELVLTQLSEGLAAELTELMVTECVWETCSQELK